MNNPDAPHIVHLRLVYEIMQKLPTGECSGWPIKDRMSGFVISGLNIQECQNKANDIFEKVNQFIEELINKQKEV